MSAPNLAVAELATPGTGGRRAFVSRKTKETEIAAAARPRRHRQGDIETGIGFLDHMLESWPATP